MVAVVHGREFVPLPLDDLTTVIELGEALDDVVRSSLNTSPRIAPDDARLNAPLQRFRRDILCTGWNYWDHFEEGVGSRGKHEVDRPDRPTFFTKGPDTIIGPNDPISFDRSISQRWDYEAELALVFGRQGRSIPASRAVDHVWGYFLANDISQRDLQHAHGGQWLKGKSIDGTMPIGPVVVTKDEIDPANVALKCTLNGEVMQSASTRQMAFDIPELVAELSWGMTVRPRDVLLTGTPSGIGNARDPQVFLAPGDEVVVTGEGIGELRNRVAEVAISEYGDDAPATPAG